MFGMLRGLVGLLAVVAVTDSNASTVYGYLDTIIMKPDYALVSLTMPAPAGSCNGSLSPSVGQYKVNMSQPTGDALLKQLLHAHDHGLHVWLVGTGTCDQAGRETVDFIQVYY
ncbi:MAG TPA: hypothetical protein VLR71_19140 [Casimicrobiaceae bacterium]|nr:hypothetical protein [Casimicrobiaceae bacterium]